VQDVRYFRQQAQGCLKIAKQLSDGAAADKLRESAVQYLAQAMMLEAELFHAPEEDSFPPKSRPAGRSQPEPK
jgi:hypothetical protein